MCIAAAVAGAAVAGSVYSANKQSKAAKSAANTQAKSADAAAQQQREMFDIARSDLSPFVSFATSPIGGDGYSGGGYASGGAGSGEDFDNFNWQEYLRQNPDVADPNQWRGHGTPQESAWAHYQMYGKPEGRQFTPINADAYSNAGKVSDSSPMGMFRQLLTPTGGYDYLKSNPLFQAGLDNANRTTMGIQAARGKLGSGDTLKSLSDNTILTAMPLLQNQQNQLLNAIQIGQSSAAGQANTALNTGNSLSDLSTQRGNALAAGQIGQANAQTGAWNSLLGAGASLGGAYLMGR